ncbi:MAG: hypothetical protein B6245_21250 [Desulfobacteraceae bacterium 4572_88]|nr:MAG: hypothetical protein B6245_21250 [Desulfobacteraceae bacterium 4572_88]
MTSQGQRTFAFLYGKEIYQHFKKEAGKETGMEKIAVAIDKGGAVVYCMKLDRKGYSAFRDTGIGFNKVRTKKLKYRDTIDEAITELVDYALNNGWELCPSQDVKASEDANDDNAAEDANEDKVAEDSVVPQLTFDGLSVKMEPQKLAKLLADVTDQNAWEELGFPDSETYRAFLGIAQIPEELCVGASASVLMHAGQFPKVVRELFLRNASNECLTDPVQAEGVLSEWPYTCKIDCGLDVEPCQGCIYGDLGESEDDRYCRDTVCLLGRMREKYPNERVIFDVEAYTHCVKEQVACPHRAAIIMMNGERMGVGCPLKECVNEEKDLTDWLWDGNRRALVGLLIDSSDVEALDRKGDEPFTMSDIFGFHGADFRKLFNNVCEGYIDLLTIAETEELVKLLQEEQEEQEKNG